VILTVTLNPALDVTYAVDGLVVGATHRVRTVAERAGGKGVNVARVLHAHGTPVRATGYAGGDTGTRITAQLAGCGIPAAFLPIAGESRRTVTVTDGGVATGFWEPGPTVSPAEWLAFLDHYGDQLPGAAAVVLAGSLPPGVPADAYAVLVALAQERGVPAVLDADGAALRCGVAAEPLLAKPNAAELSAATGLPVSTVDEARTAARALRGGRPTSVVASLGGAGVVAATAHGDLRAFLPEPVVGNATGAGDACVAALVRGLLAGAPWPEVLARAVAGGAAAAAAPVAGMVDEDLMGRLRKDVVVEEI
jgi:tagatose 6-phosphate kinase